MFKDTVYWQNTVNKYQSYIIQATITAKETIKGQKTFVKQYREELSVPRSLVTSSTANRVMRISFSDVSR